MSKLYEVQVRVPNHIRKFLLARYGEKGISFHHNLHEMGVYIRSFTVDLEEYYRPARNNSSIMKFMVKRGLKDRIDSNLFSHDEKIYQYLPIWLDYLFTNTLINWVAAGRALSPDTTIKRMIELFMLKHGIEDELDLKNLYQIWHRHVNRDKECTYENI